MLGQEDNPARLKEEIEKAKLHQQQPPQKCIGRSTPKQNPEALSDADVASMENALYDPRSYSGQKRSQANGDNFGGRDHERDLRFFRGDGGLLYRRKTSGGAAWETLFPAMPPGVRIQARRPDHRNRR